MSNEFIQPSDRISEAIEAEALAWVAQLNGDTVSEEDVAAFREWIGRSSVHAAEIQSLAGFWQELNVLTDMRAPIHQADCLARQLRRDARRRNRRGWALATAAACATIFAVALWFEPWPTLPVEGVGTAEVVLDIPTVLKSAKGEQQKHVLADGSVVTLNTDSLVEVDYSTNQRSVRLLAGEALFSVAHDTGRPFLVFTNAGIVRAVGTEFSVHLNRDGVDVIVSEGAVELSTLLPTKPGSDPVVKQADLSSFGVIRAGHTAVIRGDKASIEAVTEAHIEARLSWQNGFLTFTGETLSEVIDEVGRYTDVDVVFADPDIAALRLGGVFKSGETDMLFRSLEANFGLSVAVDDNNQVTIARN